jgi:hypothetical protein
VRSTRSLSFLLLFIIVFLSFRGEGSGNKKFFEEIGEKSLASQHKGGSIGFKAKCP